MRVFVCFKDSWESFNIPPDQTVAAMRKLLKDSFLVKLSDDQQYLELTYCGAVLQDSWALCDVGIKSGSAIHCHIKVTEGNSYIFKIFKVAPPPHESMISLTRQLTEQKPVLCVFNAVTGETLPIMGSVSLLKMSVSKLKTVVSVQSGLPVSTFRLSTPDQVQLYDCNQLQDYAIRVGTILRLDTWDGWVEYLQGCLLGQRLTVQGHLSEERAVMRFQLRVALYIAASLGHLDLAGWLLGRGAHAEEPVGVHPYRQWCHQTAHRDTGKCPIHAAAESCQLLILKLFVTRNLLSLACRDPWGRDPLKIAIQHGHRDLVRYLVGKLCSVVSLQNVSLPMHIYLKIKRWISLGQRRAASARQYTFRGRMLLVDGFNQPKMSSRPRRAGVKPNVITNIPSLPYLPTKVSSLHLKSKESLSPDTSTEMQRKHKASSNKGNPFLLPPITRQCFPRQVPVGSSSDVSLDSSHHCGPTLRDNAAYCLTIASSFTQKPWLKQLSIARTLARKHIQTRA